MRAVLSPDTSDAKVVDESMEIMRARLNIFGLSDTRVFSQSDLAGKKYIVVEAAGLTEDDVRQVVARQGKFEARIGNATIFTGAQIMVDVYQSRIQARDKGYLFMIPLTITDPAAADKFAAETSRLSLTFDDIAGAESFLNESLDLLIDDKVVDSLRIAADLKGRVFNNPVVQGGAENRTATLSRMNQMKAILQSGSLPVKIELSSVERVSSKLGERLLSGTLLAGLIAVLAVALVVFLRYRDPRIAFLILSTVVAEALLVLGLAVAMKRIWQLDLAAIAGIIVSLGTGVNQEIIMTDEFLKYGLDKKKLSFKEQIKNASFIIFAAFGSGIAAMLPLFFIGLGAVRGFAITTLIGMASGVFITRPAFIVMLEELMAAKAAEPVPAAAVPAHPAPAHGPSPEGAAGAQEKGAGETAPPSEDPLEPKE